MKLRGNREGIALMLVIIVVMVTATVAAGAAVIGANSWLLTQHEERQSLLQAGADAGLEEGRARINGNMTLYPNTLFVQLDTNRQVVDGAGTPIVGVRRNLYVGPTGMTTGQYGVFGSVVSVVTDANGDRVVRRAEIAQESFAKYAYFTDVEGAISFTNGDRLDGPVHSNDDINIMSASARFLGPVTLAGTIGNPNWGIFSQGFQENAAVIPMPQTATLISLQNFATIGGLAFTPAAGGTADQSTMRFWFIAIDLNGDGDRTDLDEGFMRIYTVPAANVRWLAADSTGSNWRTSQNCGDRHGVADFRHAAGHANPNTADDWIDALRSGTSRCYLGGSDELWDGVFTPVDAFGQWMLYPGVPDPRLAARPDRQYLFPLSRSLNPNFRGVIHVTGKIVISGELRSRITLAATDNIIIGDDFRYSVDPVAGTCTDIMGLFSGTDVIIADNGINNPQRPDGNNPYQTWDDTSDEFLHSVVLALDNFRVFNHDQGSNNAEPCQGSAWGRGCLFLSGGVIQRTRGAVGTGGGTGYLKRYSYDACAASDPPPYFPTTGRFSKTRVFEVDPTGFTIGTYFNSLVPR